jgi:hypothetical protein
LGIACIVWEYDVKIERLITFHVFGQTSSANFTLYDLMKVLRTFMGFSWMLTGNITAVNAKIAYFIEMHDSVSFNVLSVCLSGS